MGDTSYLWQTIPFKKYHSTCNNIRYYAFGNYKSTHQKFDVFNQDFIKTAKAKGLSKSRIVIKHSLKNALNPVLTAISGWFASLMAGAFFVEYIFDWKGIGYTTIKAVQSLDFPVVMGTTIFIAIAFVLINIFADIIYAILDPRVRLNS